MKILIIAPSWIGDAIMSQTMYKLLIKNNAKTKIDVITPYWNQAVFHRMPEIQKVLSFTFFKHGSLALKKYYQLGKSLKQKEQYQQSIILPNSLKSGLIPFFAKIPQRTGWRGEMRYGIINDIRILNSKKFPRMLERYAALAFKKEQIKNTDDFPSLLPHPCLNCTLQESNKTIKKFNINNTNNNKKIGICPGSGRDQLKCWPMYHYATLIIQLIYQGYQIILLGSYKEKKIGITIKNTLPTYLRTNCHNLIGLTSLEEAILIIKNCDLIISNDSGLMHVSCALQKPIIALYGGSSNPNFTPPLYHHSKIIQLTSDSPCENKKHKKKITKKTYQYNQYHSNLINIHPQKVLETVNQFIKKHFNEN